MLNLIDRPGGLLIQDEGFRKLAFENPNGIVVKRTGEIGETHGLLSG